MLNLVNASPSEAAIFDIPDGDIDALKSAINIANANGDDDTIELATNGIYTVSTVDNFYVNALPAISSDGGHSLTIHGNGATLQRNTDYATPPLRFFSLDPGATLIVDALTMLGGDVRNAPGNTSTVCGAAAYNHGGVLIVVNSAFRGNRANIGGAIYNDGEYDAITLQLTNCVVENNSAILGGAISNYSPGPSIVITIDQCMFMQNAAIGSFSVGRGGGAIMIDTYGASTNITITRSTFTDNSAFSMSGGVICNRGGNITITNSSFLQNYASEGGVVYNNGATPASLVLNTCFIDGNSNCAIANHGNSGTATAIIRDSTFTNNYNPYWGGAIWNGGDHGAARVEIENCSFIHNAANFAGAVYNDCFDYGSAALTVTTTTFDTNSANQIGGAIMNAAESTGTTNCDVNSCTFNNNFAVSGISIANGLYAPGDPNLQVQLRSSIFQTWTNRDNLVGDPGTIVSLGYNLTNDDGSGVLNATGDQINADAMLDPAGPQNNGGPTATISLSRGSPAIDAGDPNAPKRDQRHYPRIGSPDIGAFEYSMQLGAMMP